MKTERYTDIIDTIYVEDTCDKIPIAIVTFNNSDGQFTDDPIFDANRELEVSVGYPEAGYFVKVGKFITRPATQIFSGKQQVIVEGWGEEVALSFPEKRRVWTDESGVIDSDIVKEIAEEHGFDIDIEPTIPIYKQVTQANENDMSFLMRRAELYGYIVYVKYGILHFHSPKYNYSGVTLRYHEGTTSNLTGFTVGIDNGFRSKQYMATQIDPKTQQIFTVEGSELADQITETTSSPYGEVDMWDKLMAAGTRIPSGFLVNQGQQQIESAYQSLVDARSKSSRWVLRGSGKCVGMPDLDAGETINIIGIGKWSGEYLLTKVAHDYTMGGYSVRFDVTRTWTGKSSKSTMRSKGSAPARDHADNKSAGEVEIDI